MNKWSFSLLVVLSVLNPIVTSVGGELIDGYRESCADFEILPISKVHVPDRFAFPIKNRLNNQGRSSFNDNVRLRRTVDNRSEWNSNAILRRTVNGRKSSLRETSSIRFNTEDRRYTPQIAGARYATRDLVNRQESRIQRERDESARQTILDSSRLATRDLLKQQESIQRESVESVRQANLELSRYTTRNLLNRQDSRVQRERVKSTIQANLERSRFVTINLENRQESRRERVESPRQTNLERSSLVTRDLVNRQESRIQRERVDSARRANIHVGNRRSLDLIRADLDYRRIREGQNRQDRNRNEARRTTSDISKSTRREILRIERRSRSNDENLVNRKSVERNVLDFEVRQNNERNSNSKYFNELGELNDFSAGRNRIVNLDQARNSERSARTRAGTRYLQQDSRFEQIRHVNREDQRLMESRARYQLVNDRRVSSTREAERRSISETRNVEAIRDTRRITNSGSEIRTTEDRFSNFKQGHTNIRVMIPRQESRLFTGEGRRAASESRMEDRRMVRANRFEYTVGSREESHERFMKRESRNPDRRNTRETNLNRRAPVENRKLVLETGHRLKIDPDNHGTEAIRDFRKSRVTYRDMSRTNSKTEAKDQYTTFDWQYVLYGVQTIYACGILAQFINGNLFAKKKGLSLPGFLDYWPTASNKLIKAE